MACERIAYQPHSSASDQTTKAADAEVFGGYGRPTGIMGRAVEDDQALVKRVERLYGGGVVRFLPFGSALV
jgi:hypothetical protein